MPGLLPKTYHTVLYTCDAFSATDPSLASSTQDLESWVWWTHLRTSITNEFITNKYYLKHKSCIVLFIQWHTGPHRCVFGGRKRHSQSFCQERTFVDMFRTHPCLPRVTHMSSCTPARMYKEGLHGSVSCVFSVVSVVILSFVQEVSGYIL